MQVKEKKIGKLWTVLLAAIFFIAGLLTLGDYGMNWDEYIHFIRGQAYWRYFTAGKRNYNDLPILKIHLPQNDRIKYPPNFDFDDDSRFRRSLYQDNMWNFDEWLVKDGGHPPLADILAAGTNWLFYQKLGWLGDIEAYHLLIIFNSSLLVFLIGFWATKEFGGLAGLVAVLSLVLYPLFLGETHFNIKDPVETTFFTLTLFTFFQGITKNSNYWLVASAVLAGMALGVKFNIIFLPLIILPWLITRGIKKSLNRKLVISLLFYPAIAFLTFFLSWPYLWQDPLGRFLGTVQYYKKIGVQHNFQPQNFYFHGFNTYPIQAVIFSTPLVILFLTLVGIIACFYFFRKEKEKTSFLWLLWFLVPILRVSLPGTSIYGGVRQIMEYIPAMALLAGLGASRMVKIKKPFSHLAIQLLIFLMFLPIIFKLISLHPHQSLYFNPLIGGLKGAAEKNFPHWGLSLGNEYRQGIKWFNQNAPVGADLTLAKGHLPNIPRIWIRSDINFGDHYFSGFQKKGEYIMGLIYYGWEEGIEDKADYLKTIKPIYQFKVEDVVVLSIWKND